MFPEARGSYLFACAKRGVACIAEFEGGVQCSKGSKQPTGNLCKPYGPF